MSATLSGGLAEALLVAMGPEQAEQPEEATPSQPSSVAQPTPPPGLRVDTADLLHAAGLPRGGSGSGTGAGCSAAAETRQPQSLPRPVLLSCEGRSYTVRTKYLGAPGTSFDRLQLDVLLSMQRASCG